MSYPWKKKLHSRHGVQRKKNLRNCRYRISKGTNFESGSICSKMSGFEMSCSIAGAMSPHYISASVFAVSSYPSQGCATYRRRANACYRLGSDTLLMAGLCLSGQVLSVFPTTSSAAYPVALTNAGLTKTTGFSAARASVTMMGALLLWRIARRKSVSLLANRSSRIHERSQVN